MTKYNAKAKFDSTENKKIIWRLKLLIFVVSFFIIWQLGLSVYTNIQWSYQEDIQKGISSTFCPNNRNYDEEEQLDEDGNIYQTAQHLNPDPPINKECANDWSYFLVSLPNASQTDEESQKNMEENELWVNITVTIDLFFILCCY